MASASFMRKLRLLTRVYDVPLVFDEVQTGWGMTGRLWAHELFDLPCPPDVVTWAKKAQNGILFVSEALATFFQEEKKFNTTWEGDSAGMVRLLALLDHLDLEQVRRTGDLARRGLDALAREYREIVKNVRGAGVMLGVRRRARRPSRSAARSRVPPRPHPPAGWRAGGAFLSALRHARRPRSTMRCRFCARRSRISTAAARRPVPRPWRARALKARRRRRRRSASARWTSRSRRLRR